MTEKYLKSLIKKLNTNKADNLIYLRPLSSQVYFAKVWLKIPKSAKDFSGLNGPYSFYFIKNEEGIYVATVLVMSSDLHWYVEKNFRGRGYLTSALKQIILYHLFQDRTEQRISINRSQIGEANFRASENVALSLGFKNINENEYLLSSDNYQVEDYIDGENTIMSEEKIDCLKTQMQYLAQSLSIIQSEIEMKLGMADFVEELGETIKTLNAQAFELKEEWYIQNEKR